MSRLTDREIAVLTTLCRTAVKAKPDYPHGRHLLSALEELAALRNEYVELQASRDRAMELNRKQDADLAALVAALRNCTLASSDAQKVCWIVESALAAHGADKENPA